MIPAPEGASHLRTVSGTTALRLAIAPCCRQDSPWTWKPFAGWGLSPSPISTNPAECLPPPKLPITAPLQASTALSAPQGSSLLQVVHTCPCISVPCQPGQLALLPGKGRHQPCTAMGAGSTSPLKQLLLLWAPGFRRRKHPVSEGEHSQPCPNKAAFPF